MNRRLLMTALPAWLAVPRANAQDAAPPPGKYVMMSLVGDQVSYVGRNGGVTGTNLSHNLHKEEPMAGAPFDITALQVIAGELPKSVPGASMSFLKGSLPEYFSDQIDWFDSGVLKLPDALKAAVSGEQANFLLLLTKWRGEAAVSDDRGESIGQGKLAGLGFYTDMTRTVDGGSSAYGFTAPYVYALLSLVDLSNLHVVRDIRIHVARPMPFGNARMGALQDLLIASLQDAVPKVLKPA